MAKAPTYDLLTEFTSGDTGTLDSTSSAPYWCICVFPLGYPLSFSRKNMKSASEFPADGAKLRGPRLIITGDCTQISVNNQKSSHLKQMSAQIGQGSLNYLVEILPGDWVMAWIVNYEEVITGNNGIINRLLQGEPCNQFDDGLKFVGRVDSIRKTVMRGADGELSSNYSLNATGFKELDNQIFYDHNLAEFAQTQVGTWLAKIGLDIRELFNQSANGNVQDNTHILIPSLFEILFGKGISSDINPAGKGVLQSTTGSLAPTDSNNPKEAPFAYLVPEEVGQALNKQSRSKQGGILAYADLMELLFGVQQYSNTGATADPFSVMIPDIDTHNTLTTAQHRFTGTPMLGAYLPMMPSFSNTPFWNVLEQFLNPVINEMYTCLRVNESGFVVPQLVLRQIPFTTDVFADSNSQALDASTSGALDQTETRQINVTRFLSLPRWKMSPRLIAMMNIGRSDVTRVNFVHIYGQNGYNAGVPIVRQLVANPPIRDDLDIQRSGLRPFITTVACDAVNQAGKTPSVWMKLVADRMIGSQFTLNGTMVLTGISAPICEGDNLEFQDVVYHIESVSHNAQIDPNGTRTFATTLQLSNGMEGYPEASITGTAGVNSEASIYPGVDNDSLQDNDPGDTDDHDDDVGESNGGLGSNLPKKSN